MFTHHFACRRHKHIQSFATCSITYCECSSVRLNCSHCLLMYDRLLTFSFSDTAAFAYGKAPRLCVHHRVPFAGVTRDPLRQTPRSQYRSTSRCYRCASHNGGQSSPPPAPPPDPDAAPHAVAEWARAIFLSEVEKADDRINLAKVGLLISLEEEAAAQAHRADNDPTALLPDLLVLRRQLARFVNAAVMQNVCQSRRRTQGADVLLPCCMGLTCQLLTLYCCAT